ncbi:MAG: hypothetical protein H7Y11_11555, partial [Armatimonadetes bacterium]|nr:hypothetical protein [Anaerolineae bacterium]
ILDTDDSTDNAESSGDLRQVYLYEPNAFRASDHDPLIVGVALAGDLTTPSATFTPSATNTPNEAELTATAGGATLTASATFTPTATLSFTATSTFTVTPSVTFTPSATSTLSAPELTATAGGATLTATNTPTVTPSITPTGTATSTVTLTATATSGTPAGTLTPTATSTPAGVELLLNGSFETLGNDGKPDASSWTIINGTSDKAKCNKAGKPDIANTGECAFRFKGSIGEAGKLRQEVVLTNFVFAQGNTLTLSYALNAEVLPVGKAKLRVKYSDADKGKLNLAYTATVGYQVFADSYVLVSTNVTQIKVEFANQSASGKFYIDDASLQQTTASALLPLPMLSNQ